MRKYAQVHDTGSSSPFNWKGSPSTFTTGQDKASFTGTSYAKSVQAAASRQLNAVSLPGGSPYLPPPMMGKPK